MAVYIMGAGEFCGFFTRPLPHDLVIAADGGYATCQKEGIMPDLVLGDFDSLGAVPEHPNTFIVPVEKDDTDMMLAMKKGLSMGHREFHLYGGTGGRLDHTLANLQSLLYLARHGARGWLYDKNARYTVLENGILTLPAQDDGILSVFAMDGKTEGVTITGAKYPLSDGILTPDFPLGVSNHFVGQAVTVTAQKGALLICVGEEE